MQFGIEDLKALPDQTGSWDGVRNYQVERLKPQNQLTKTFGGWHIHFVCGNVDPQARNFMRQMKDGQLAFFYHSNCKEPGIAGLMKVSHSIPAHNVLMI